MENIDFESLVGRINQVQDLLQAQAAHAVNLSLTSRNWLVGYYIVEFEQHGEDRAKYGDNLLKKLAKRLNRRGLGERRLYEYRLTYQVYPQLGRLVAGYVVKKGQNEILRSVTAISIDEHYHHQPQLPPHHPQEQSALLSQEIPVRISKWRGAEVEVV